MKSGSLVRVIWAVGFAFPLALAAAPESASACGTAVKRVVDDNSMRVSRSEQLLGDGKYAMAAVSVVQAFPALKIVKVGDSPLSDRALRIMALANVRTEGAVNVGGFQAANPAQKAANLEWAVATLRSLNAKRINNPTYQTDLGEALSKLPKHQDEARKLLGDLADKDLLTSAEGYAALARLRAASGDSAGRDAAVKRCEGMAKEAKVCQIGAPADAAAKPRAGNDGGRPPSPIAPAGVAPAPGANSRS